MKQLLWLGLLVAMVAVIVGVLLWSGGERSSWAHWQDEHHESGHKNKDGATRMPDRIGD